MYYQLSLYLHKILNDHEYDLSFEHITVMEQMICARRQTSFQTLRNLNIKIGLNTTANKLYPLNNLIGLDRLNLSFVHLKKLSKIQFLKNGNT